ncbi:MAG TPA: aldehyde dehydrogenase family protein, partial [Planctomycetaceae bacterium]|nr:aldehyde dehydrogenase family protein [Planctomycetaceae bacterium]
SATVRRYAADPSVQVHGPGRSKILFGDDQVDRWRDHLDVMVESVLANGGRSCINCSGIWVSRHGRAIAEAMAERLSKVEPRPLADPQAELAAFTDPQVAKAIADEIEAGCREPGVTDVTAPHCKTRLVVKERSAFLLPTVVHCERPDRKLANVEYLFPFVAVVECPQAAMLEAIGPTLVCTAITEDRRFSRDLLDTTSIDRLNLGPLPTTAVDWRQPHEGNLVEFLFRHRAVQVAQAGSG